MPLLSVNTTQTHPQHKGREVLTVVGTLHGTPVVSKVSTRTDEFVVIRLVIERSADGRGKVAKDVRVTYGGSTLAGARAFAAKHGGTVWQRTANSYRRVSPSAK